MKKEKPKLYFKTVDDTFCSPLESHLHDAKIEGLEKITLIEADPDNDNPDFIWCSQHGECVERNQCKKSECSAYESKSGRGVCSNRGGLFSHGNEVEFNVETHEQNIRKAEIVT